MKTKAKKPSGSAAKKADAPSESEQSGEERQLARILQRFEPLSSREAAGLLAAYSDDECAKLGVETRSANTFRDAMGWARVLDEHQTDPAVSTRRARWMLDCLAQLSFARRGEQTAASPIAAGNLLAQRERAVALDRDTTEFLDHALGKNAAWRATLTAALAAPSTFDPQVARLNAIAKTLSRWLDADDAPPLSAFDLSANTVRELETAAKALDTALAAKPAAKTSANDSPAVNIAEGRLFFAMRVIWADFARARRNNKSKLLLPVTPTLLRGLNVQSRKKAKKAGGE